MTCVKRRDAGRDPSLPSVLAKRFVYSGLAKPSQPRFRRRARMSQAADAATQSSGTAPGSLSTTMFVTSSASDKPSATKGSMDCFMMDVIGRGERPAIQLLGGACICDNQEWCGMPRSASARAA